MKKKYSFGVIVLIALFGFQILIPMENGKNPELSAINNGNAPTTAENNQVVDYLIITGKNMVETLNPLLEWKTQKGLRTIILTVEEISHDFSGVDLPEKIKNCINDYYLNKNTTWVLLAGDVDTIPSRDAYAPEEFSYDGDTVSCDFYYSDLDNDWDKDNDGLWGDKDDEMDYNAEVYVGRLCTSNSTEMEHLVQNIVDYETDPDVGSWMTSALYAGAMLFFDSDFNQNNQTDFGECDANRHHNFLANNLPDNWTSLLMAEDEGLKNSSYHYDLAINDTDLQEQINNGYSIGMICGHGWQQGMQRLLFETDFDGDGLFDYTADPYFGGGEAIDEDLRLPLITTSTALNLSNNRLGMYYLGGCSTGTFDDSKDCMSEYFLKNVAIGCIAGSHVVWGEDQWTERDYGGWYSEGLSSRFWEQLFINNQPGKAFSLAKADYVADRESIGIDDDKGYFQNWEQKVLKQFNLLGDPEVNLWQTIPERLNITQIESNWDTAKFLVKANDKNISGIQVTLRRASELMWKGFTDSGGMVEVPFSADELKYMTITANENQYIPSIIKNVENYIPEETKPKIDGYNILFIIGSGFIGIVFVFLARRKQSMLKN